jgi:hypothetical protein
VGDPEELLRELATSMALVPQERVPQERVPQEPQADGQEAPDGAISLPVIEQDGRRYVPVFTSEEALRAAGADAATALRLPVLQLAAGWPSDDLWLAVNPGSDDGLALPPEVVRALVELVQPDDPGQTDAG